jgi:hypothetical protein
MMKVDWKKRAMTNKRTLTTRLIKNALLQMGYRVK